MHRKLYMDGENDARNTQLRGNLFARLMVEYRLAIIYDDWETRSIVFVLR